MSLSHASYTAMGSRIEVTWQWNHTQPCDGIYIVWSAFGMPTVYDAPNTQREFVLYDRHKSLATWSTATLTHTNRPYFIAIFGQYSTQGKKSHILLHSGWAQIGYKMKIKYRLLDMNKQKRKPQLGLVLESFLPHGSNHPIPDIWIELDAVKGNRPIKKLDPLHLDAEALQILFSGKEYLHQLNYNELASYLPFGFRLNTDKNMELNLQPIGNMQFTYIEDYVIPDKSLYEKIADMVNQGSVFIDIYRRLSPPMTMTNQLYELQWNFKQLFHIPLPVDDGFSMWLAIIHYRIYHDLQWYEYGLRWLETLIPHHKSEQQVNGLLQTIVVHGIQQNDRLAYDFMKRMLELPQDFMGRHYLMKLWLAIHPDDKVSILRAWIEKVTFAPIAFNLLVQEIHHHAHRADFDLLRDFIYALPSYLNLADCLEQYVACEPFKEDILQDIHKWLSRNGLQWTAQPEPYLACAIRFAGKYIEKNPPLEKHSKAFFSDINDKLKIQPARKDNLAQLLHIVIRYIKHLPFSFDSSADQRRLSAEEQMWRKTVYDDLQQTLDNVLYLNGIEDEVWDRFVELGIMVSNFNLADKFLRHWDMTNPKRMTDILRIISKSQYPITPKVVETLLNTLNYPDTPPSHRHRIYEVLLEGYFEDGERQFSQFGDAIMGYMRLKNKLTEDDVIFWCDHYLIERVPALASQFAHIHLDLVIKIWEKLPHPNALETLVEQATTASQLPYLKAHVPQTGYFNLVHEWINTRLQQDVIESRRQQIVREWATIHDQIGGGIPKTLSAGGSVGAYRQYSNLYEQAITESHQFAIRLQEIGAELNRINEIVRDIQQLRLDIQRIIEELNLQNQAHTQQRATIQNAERTIQSLNRRLENLGAIENTNVQSQLAQVRQANLDAMRALTAQLNQMINTGSGNADAYRNQLRQLQMQEQAYSTEHTLLDQRYSALNDENNRASARIELLTQFNDTVQLLITEIGRNHDDKQETTRRINELRTQWRDNHHHEIPIQIDAIMPKRRARNLALYNRAKQLTLPSSGESDNPTRPTKSF